MNMLIRMEMRKLKRSRIVGLAVFADFLLAAVVFVRGLECYNGPDMQYGVKSLENGTRYLANAGWFMDEVQPWSVFFVLPAVTALLGSYLICREKEGNTEKMIRMIPVNAFWLTAAKLIVACFWSILLYTLLLAAAFLTEYMLHADKLSKELFFVFLKEYLITGIGVFAAVSPVIAGAARKRKYWYAPAAAEILSVLSLLLGRGAIMKNLYPVTAIFNVSGYAGASTRDRMISAASLLACIVLSVFLLRGIDTGTEKVKIREKCDMMKKNGWKKKQK